jgi:MFS family permease
MIALIGQPGLSVAMLFVVVFLAGFGIFSGQAGNNAVAATYYPTTLRSTGVGAALGIGRIGSILGPYVAEFMRPRYSTQQLFLVFAVPALLSAAAVAALRTVMRPATIEGWPRLIPPRPFCHHASGRCSRPRLPAGPTRMRPCICGCRSSARFV